MSVSPVVPQPILVPAAPKKKSPKVWSIGDKCMVPGYVYTVNGETRPIVWAITAINQVSQKADTIQVEGPDESQPMHIAISHLKRIVVTKDSFTLSLVKENPEAALALSQKLVAVGATPIRLSCNERTRSDAEELVKLYSEESVTLAQLEAEGLARQVPDGGADRPKGTIDIHSDVTPEELKTMKELASKIGVTINPRKDSKQHTIDRLSFWLYHVNRLRAEMAAAAKA